MDRSGRSESRHAFGGFRAWCRAIGNSRIAAGGIQCIAITGGQEMRRWARPGKARRSLLDPRGWPTIVRAIAQSLMAMIRKEQSVPGFSPHGGRLGLPADFLIASDGRVVACKYGVHVDDQWSVDQLLDLARSEREIVGASGVEFE